MNYWFVADLHLGHKNICKYCNRPFNSVEEMDNALITNWNNCVKHDDIVYFLGDFAFGNEKKIANYFRRLNGNIKIVFGNHDKTLRKFAKKDINAHSDLRDRIEFLGDYHELTLNNQFIVLSHYSFRVWNKSHRSSWNLFGHSHGTLEDNPHSLSFDCGVDCHNYAPINFEQVKEIMNKKHYTPIDHHGQILEGGGIGLNKEDYAKLERKRMLEQLKKEFNET